MKKARFATSGCLQPGRTRADPVPSGFPGEATVDSIFGCHWLCQCLLGVFLFARVVHQSQLPTETRCV